MRITRPLLALAFSLLTSGSLHAQVRPAGAPGPEVRAEPPCRFTPPSEAAPPNAWDAANPGLRRLSIRVSSAAQSAGQLAVVAAPGDVNFTAPAALPALPLAEW